MIGFSYRNLILQVIPGIVIILTFLFFKDKPLNADYFKSYDTTAFFLLLFFAFLSGVTIDFVADIMESVVMKFILIPPIFYLLTKNRWFGIALAHKTYIFNKLCRIAAKHDERDVSIEMKNEEYYHSRFLKADRKIVNYILQVAKNKAFRVCKDYQKEQIDSFFILYIFSRNISLSFLISSIGSVLIATRYGISIVLLLMGLISLAASYRYYLYYSRILLGTTIKKDNH